MKTITQTDINRVCEILKENQSLTSYEDLIKKLQETPIIPSLYVLTYLKKVNDLMDSCKIKNAKRMEFDLEKWKKALQMNHELELGAFIETTDTLEGAFWLIYHALDRQNKFCDWDDSKAIQTKKGRCEEDNHLENIEEPIVPLTELQQKNFDKISEKHGAYYAKEKYLDNFNPSDQELKVIHGWDEDSAKLIQNEIYYICSACSEALANGDGGMPICDSEIGE